MNTAAPSAEMHQNTITVTSYPGTQMGQPPPMMTSTMHQIQQQPSTAQFTGLAPSTMEFGHPPPTINSTSNTHHIQQPYFYDIPTQQPPLQAMPQQMANMNTYQQQAGMMPSSQHQLLSNNKPEPMANILPMTTEFTMQRDVSSGGSMHEKRMWDQTRGDMGVPPHPQRQMGGSLQNSSQASSNASLTGGGFPGIVSQSTNPPMQTYSSSFSTSSCSPYADKLRNFMIVL